MPNIKITPNVWACYYDDETEEKGFYIDEVYVGTDPDRANIADFMSDSFMQYAEEKILDDIELRRAWA